jgi:putative toxin-antitoxin system antitoxin component (TIGR02293 family)
LAAKLAAGAALPGRRAGTKPGAAPVPPLREQEALVPETLRLLGGGRWLRHKPSSPAEIHATVVDGIPYSALIYLSANTKSLSEADVAGVVGISPRTLRRQKETPDRPMPPDLGSRTWLFAEILAKAEDVFGGKEEAERWMVQEALGLDGARPIDLLRTVQGAQLVGQFLDRLKAGVYN